MVIGGIERLRKERTSGSDFSLPISPRFEDWPLALGIIEERNKCSVHDKLRNEHGRLMALVVRIWIDRALKYS
jgi:hypothetical protein